MSRENRTKSLDGAAAEKAQLWQALIAAANLGRSTQVKQSATACNCSRGLWCSLLAAHPHTHMQACTHTCTHMHIYIYTHPFKKELKLCRNKRKNEGCRLEISFLIYRGVKSICKLKEKHDREGDTWNTAKSRIVTRSMKKQWLRVDPGLRGKQIIFTL